MSKKKQYSESERKSFGRGFFTGIKKTKHPKKRLAFKKKKFDVSIGADGRYYSDESGRMQVITKEQALASGMPISRVVSYSELTPKQKKEHDKLKNELTSSLKNALDYAGIKYQAYGGDSKLKFDRSGQPIGDPHQILYDDQQRILQDIGYYDIEEDIF